jgi:predicted nucleotidyltransferase
MSKKPSSDIFSSSNSMKVLSFLADNPGQEFLSTEIQHGIFSSRAGAYLALKDLVGRRLVIRKERGRFHLYFVEHAHPLVRQFKILKNIVRLEPLLLQLKPLTIKIVLFGSAGRGEDTFSSDIDLFVLAPEPETTAEILASFPIERKIQPIVMAPAELPDFENKNKTFYDEIDRGIILWEEKDGPGVRRMPEEG